MPTNIIRNECKLINVIPWDPDEIDRIFVEVDDADTESFQESADQCNTVYLQICEEKGIKPSQAALIYDKKNTERENWSSKQPKSKKKTKRKAKKKSSPKKTKKPAQKKKTKKAVKKKKPQPIEIDDEDDDDDNAGPPPLEGISSNGEKSDDSKSEV